MRNESQDAGQQFHGQSIHGTFDGRVCLADGNELDEAWLVAVHIALVVPRVVRVAARNELERRFGQKDLLWLRTLLELMDNDEHDWIFQERKDFHCLDTTNKHDLPYDSVPMSTHFVVISSTG